MERCSVQVRSPETRRLLVIAGPTASGKSALALRLARELHGGIINIDSVQVYRRCDIGSAKPSVAEREEIPHYGIDELHPAERCDAGRFAAIAHRALTRCREEGRLPILVAGTTLYFSAVLSGLAELPPGEPALRCALAQRTTKDLRGELERLDPETASRLHPHDRLRTERALEVLALSGRSIRSFWDDHAAAPSHLEALILFLHWPRESLYQRINARSAAMIRAGLLEETVALHQEFGGELAALTAVGYAQALSWVRGELAREEVEPQVAQATRRLAKRQLTFWRNEPKRRGWEMLPSGRGLPEDRRHDGRTRGEVKEFQTISFTGIAELASAACAALDGVGTAIWYVDAALLFDGQGL